jgi:predicted HTH transcriptional regulator
MTEEKIRDLLNQGEGFTVEYKECVNGLNDSVFETVASFSNRYGGYLLLGVKDEGDKGVVIIQGAILDTRAEKGSLLLYAGQYAADIKKAPLAEVIASRLRLKAKADEKKAKEEKPKESNDDVEPTEQVEATPQAEESTEATA